MKTCSSSPPGKKPSLCIDAKNALSAAGHDPHPGAPDSTKPGRRRGRSHPAANYIDSGAGALIT